jgi:phospholipase C
MPTTCQLSNQPTQEWEQAHIQFDKGANDGFVISGSGPVAMGYWTGADLPFEYSLAGTFPIGDRWFCSVLGQTYPNRMYLFAGTSMGLTDEATVEQVEGWPQPPNGTIFNTLAKYGITWKDYTALYPPPGETNPSVIAEYLEGATPLLYALDDLGYYTDEAMNVVLPGYWAALGAPTDPANNITGTFFADAAAGTLPQVTLIDPNYDVTSQENPQNIVNGEAFLASVVQAVMASPQWNTTLLIINYDEHGGYFDHVPPPAAMAPDDVGPTLLPAQAGESTYNGFMQYGFRVPSLVVSPYAKRDHVSRVVHDHTSILATIERKWNLPALTLRDANANDVLDFIDMYALRAQTQKFPASTFATFAAPGNTAAALMCSTTGPGTIPPPRSVIPASVAGDLVRTSARVDGRRCRGGGPRPPATRGSRGKDPLVKVKPAKLAIARSVTNGRDRWLVGFTRATEGMFCVSCTTIASRQRARPIRQGALSNFPRRNRIMRARKDFSALELRLVPSRLSMG